MFGQTFQAQDIALIGLLVLLEGVLSIDNALVLALLAKPLPRPLQKRALTYGLIGAFVFRLIAVAAATLLMRMRWVKLAGGLYLAYIAARHLIWTQQETSATEEDIAAKAAATPLTTHTRRFWYIVGVIELTDIAFAVDSILAAVGLVSGGDKTDKTWVVFVGGMLGVILMRFAAALFIRLLEKFPRFELSAYLLVLSIGLKLMIEGVDWLFHGDHPVVHFDSPGSPVFWIFWVTMVGCFAIGFVPRKPSTPS